MGAGLRAVIGGAFVLSGAAGTAKRFVIFEDWLDKYMAAISPGQRKFTGWTILGIHCAMMASRPGMGQ